MENIEGRRNEYTERIIAEIKELLTKSRKSVALQVNNEFFQLIGRLERLL